MIDRPMHQAPVIIEQYDNGGVRMLRSADGREFNADAFERMYGPVRIVPQKSGKHSKRG